MFRHTYFRVGGPADAFAKPRSLEALQKLINWSREKGHPLLVIGDGTNLLVKDNGIRGIVIVLTKCLNQIKPPRPESNGVYITAMAGARLHTLCNLAIDQGLEGLNFALGIPGTVGGAIMMNAGTTAGSVQDVLTSIAVLGPEGQIQKLRCEKLDFKYRRLSWKNDTQIDRGQAVIVNGDFLLHPADPQKLKKEAAAILKLRRQKQPINYPSAGCFFKNPLTGKTAGELIDAAGLKGRRIGGAEISSKHANYIINRDNASAADILALRDLIRETVARIFAIDLETEVKIVGT
jgi:UDP-N-acetylmuramate dehydrogenase